MSTARFWKRTADVILGIGITQAVIATILCLIILPIGLLLESLLIPWALLYDFAIRMRNRVARRSITSGLCPWCTAALPSATSPTCNGCGANLAKLMKGK